MKAEGEAFLDNCSAHIPAFRPVIVRATIYAHPAVPAGTHSSELLLCIRSAFPDMLGLMLLIKEPVLCRHSAVRCWANSRIPFECDRQRIVLVTS